MSFLGQGHNDQDIGSVSLARWHYKDSDSPWSGITRGPFKLILMIPVGEILRPTIKEKSSVGRSIRIVFATGK